AYWANATELVLVDEEAEWQGPLLASGTTQTCYNCPADFFVPEGLVPPGTATVIVNASVDDAGAGRQPAFHMGYATDADGAEGDFAAGEPFRITVAPNQTDAPLQRKSQWSFFIILIDNGTAIAATSHVHVRITAERAATLPTFPDPPDPWQGRDAVPLVAAATRNAAAWYASPATGYGCYACQGTAWAPDDGALVPPTAKKLHATLAWDWPTPSKPALRAGPTDQDLLEMTLVEDGATQRVFEIEVTPAVADSAYQTRSIWLFAVHFPADEQPATVASGTFTLDVDAVR
ncbi:MAG TPA: hypothetical protein VGR28_09205, partial [Candidatus Thermoplasmatota archaeon]|nr:hypothetical protein [Candidatus Thermoplasmatota archaeon]